MNINKLIEYDNQIKDIAKILNKDPMDEKFLEFLSLYWPPSSVDIKDIFTITTVEEHN